MSSADVMELARLMLWTAFLISAPLLLTALVVGVSVSLVQTVTGVQEMTLTFVPKITAVLVALIVFLPWMAAVLSTFTKEILIRMAGWQ
jgi:flagellar biosynthetic protein FliQ